MIKEGTFQVPFLVVILNTDKKGSKKMNTVYEYPLTNGGKATMTHTFARAMKAKSVKPEIYEHYCKALPSLERMGTGFFDVGLISELLYDFYMFENMDDENALKPDEFYELLGGNLEEMGNAISALMNGKK